MNRFRYSAFLVVLLLVGTSSCASTKTSSTEQTDGVLASTTTTIKVPGICTPGVSCAVGDTGPGGGTIIYAAATPFACGEVDLKSNALVAMCSYLEAAPETGELAWKSTVARWGCTGRSIKGALGVVIGTGYSDTLAISAACKESGIGADLVHAYRGPQNKNDWFLPSKDELEQLYLFRTNNGGFASDSFWSSSEASAKHAWFNNYFSGPQGYAKGGRTFVHPVRAF